MFVVFYSFRKLLDRTHIVILTCVGHSQRRARPYDGERVIVGFQDHLFGRVRDCNTVKKKKKWVSQPVFVLRATSLAVCRWRARTDLGDLVETNARHRTRAIYGVRS